MTDVPLGRTFLTVWSGQAVSTVGSSLAGVGVAVHVFVETGSAAALGWFTAIASVPFVLTSPLLPLTDRFGRRTVMVAGDALAVAGPTIALLLAAAGRLEVWHLAVAAFVGGVGTSFQFPAARAALPSLVPAGAVDRANGFDQLGPAFGIVMGPLLATPVVARWGIEAVLLIDIVTFLIAVATTLSVRFDDVPPGGEHETVEDDGSWTSTRRWLTTAGRPLLVLLALMATVNFTLSFFNVSILIIATEAGGVALAGVALGAGGLAMLAGSVVAGRRGVGADRVGAIAIGLGVIGIGFLITASRPVLALVALGVAVALAALPVVSAATSTLFHERVPPSMYGRVFGLRSAVGRALDPVGAVIAGVVVSGVTGPALGDGGVLAGSVGTVIGVGEGRGAALVVALAGLALVAIAIWLAGSHVRVALRPIGGRPAPPEPTGAELTAI